MKFQKAFDLLKRDPYRLARVMVSMGYNKVAAPAHPPSLTDSQFLNDVLSRASSKRTDISDHLVTLFLAALDAQPRLIVELGVRGGESTYVLERVAQTTNATLVSVDLEDCSNISTYPKWNFVQMDDIAFANQFNNWCTERGINPAIDFLFIDTSHLLEHTIQEVQHWLPLTSPTASVAFHDTNMQDWYWRQDGSLGITSHNNRGVIAALEGYFAKSFNEKRDFVDYQKGWLIKHYANSNGFTVLERNALLAQLQ